MAEVSKFANKLAAEVKGVRAEVRAERDKVAARAKADLAAHYRTGAAEITTSNGKKDAFVNLEDEAAGAIEWGGTRADGRPVPGLHVLRRAMGG